MLSSNSLRPFLTLAIQLFCFGVGIRASAADSVPFPRIGTLSIPSARGPVKISRLILGTDHLGKVSETQRQAVLKRALQLGITTFDTAPIYVNGIEDWLGKNLRLTGRKDLVVMSKGGFPFDLAPGTYSSRLAGTREQIVQNVLEEVSGSSQRLQPFLKIYYMHRDDFDSKDYQVVRRPQTPMPTLLAALSDPRLRQHFDILGVSNWTTARINQSQAWAARDPRLIRPAINSPYFSLLEMLQTTIHVGGIQVHHQDMMNPEFQKGVAIAPYSPLGGFGGYDIFKLGWEESEKIALQLESQGDRYWGHVRRAIFTAPNRARFSRAAEFIRRLNLKYKTSFTVDQLLNAWVLAHPRTNALTIGPLNVDQLERTVRSLHLARILTRADLEYLYSGLQIQ